MVNGPVLAAWNRSGLRGELAKLVTSGTIATGANSTAIPFGYNDIIAVIATLATCCLSLPPRHRSPSVEYDQRVGHWRIRPETSFLSLADQKPYVILRPLVIIL
jgi:hypothetical protein